MANEFLNPVVIAKELLLRWENNAVFSKFVSRDYDQYFAVPGDKIGYVYNARVPVRFRGRRGDAIRPEGINETIVPITINQLWGVDLEIGDQDLTMTVDRFGERYLESASARVSNMIDGDGLDLYGDIFNMSGVPGSLPSDLTTYTGAGVVLANSGTPMENTMLSVMVNPELQAAALGFRANLFNPAREISEQYRTGKMGEAVGFKWSMDQNVAVQTIGLCASSTPLVNGGNQSGSNLITDGWNASTQVLNKYDIISVNLMNGTNPVSYRDTNKRRTFVVTADVTSDGSGNATIPVSPDVNSDVTSVFQTVSTAPADNSPIRVYEVAAANFANISGITSSQAMAFHKEAFVLAIVNMDLPGGLDWSERVTDPKTGMSARLTRGFDIAGNKRYTRFEVMGGWKTVHPEFACRIVY